jgi:hypothetical protein
MFKATILVATIGAMTILFAPNVGAQSFGVVKSQPAGSNMTLVRDECGRGRHFSERSGRCVEDFSECGRGRHFSERRGRCVDNDEDNFRGDRGLSHGERKRLCQERCLEIRERCNRRRGGYFNGCGVEGAACIARCG